MTCRTHMKHLPRRAQGPVEDYQSRLSSHRAGLTCGNRQCNSQFLNRFQQRAARSGYQRHENGRLFQYDNRYSVVSSRCPSACPPREHGPIGRRLVQQRTWNHCVNGDSYVRTKEGRTWLSGLKPCGTCFGVSRLLTG